jgi:putative ABC transport system permease protein
VLEAALVSLLGAALGVALGWLAPLFVNAHYRAVYRTPLTFAALTPGVVALSAALALVLGVAAGFLASRRLASVPPLSLFGR